ncbi:MAG: nodulation protein nolNO [Planktothrix agardhii KL2]|jgi:carbamoyltransferase|uniref:carbamoyltransferase family protein n=1 Tax=Planktothrix agardhii TaxID=1160 RepID=UPI001A27CAC1|nr:carbamoyltransferase C-terminal domain-containing protein [Planktothrix agardhii]MBG0748913.1 nodulation protein nolNO [Planktothrix agardhii KL2]
MEKFYIGLGSTFHDSAIAVVNRQGEVIFAEATERYLQSKKAINSVPDQKEIVSMIIKNYCSYNAHFVVAKTWSKSFHFFLKCQYMLRLLNTNKMPDNSLDMIVNFLYDSVFSKNYLGFLEFIFLERVGNEFLQFIGEVSQSSQVTFINSSHHLTHAAMSCYTSPFQEGVCMVVDGYGEGGSIAYYHYKDGKIKPIKKVRGVASLGLLYAACTIFCGFDPMKGEEWKVMGLAPYGKLDEDLYKTFKEVILVKGLEIKYSSKENIKNLITKLASVASSQEAFPLKAANLAYTTQFIYSEVMTELLNNFYKLELSDNLILGGGCALNSAYNGQISEKTKFKRLYVPSAPADDGNALGAALLSYYKDNPNQARTPKIQSPYLGSSISELSLGRLKKFGQFDKLRHLPQTIHQEAAALLAQGKLLGWVQGRAEFGPRALGNRSILADPRPAEMKDKINTLVKFREEFRPFAPAILHEFGEEYFENYQESPYMERTLKFRKEIIDKVPAVVHVDGTGRLQSVKKEWNELFYQLIQAFYNLTGVPILLNTSLNVMGKPIIHSVEDAIIVFLTTGLDALVIEDYIIEK